MSPLPAAAAKVATAGRRQMVAVHAANTDADANAEAADAEAVPLLTTYAAIVVLSQAAAASTDPASVQAAAAEANISGLGYS